MDMNDSDLFPINVGPRLSEKNERNILDAFALAWIFFSVMAVGLMMLNINIISIAVVLFSAALGGIWWLLSHYKRTRR